MLTITSIRNGIVIDHIRAGLGIRMFYQLGLDKADYSVALIMNAASTRLGRKDIIKIENNVDFDVTMLALIDPNVTINVIEDEHIVRKVKPELPERVEDIIKCKNPRCITSVEKYVPHVFTLVNRELGQYRCQYCDEIYTVGQD
ncbi:MAG: aspartate carbamoyltransferase regulatory subunit [Coprothermobacter sp.]|jgi:aspartate carbamoyltransferase regulatory subunit|nr:aspartate carbamoyltransferase regulatory subunit [Coprothermobacter sp.]